MDKAFLRSFILSVVKPLKPGKSVTQKDDSTATLDNLFPDGGSDDNFRMTSPFGSIAWVPKGVSVFYQQLFGSGFENIILSFLHKKRPAPSAPGEHILYSTDANGETIKVKITLKNDGQLLIECPGNITVTTQGEAHVTAGAKATIVADEVDIGEGSLKKALLGETFQEYFNTHQHTGNLGAPTGPPISPSLPTHLSTILKTT
jgi:hypothetical protein